LHVAPGTLHCLVGPNGAGKTSLLRCLLGELPHTGRIALDWTGAPGVIGYVPQTLDFDRTLPITVEDFLTLITQSAPAFLGLRRAHRAAVDAALEAVGLAGKRHRALGKLSGGELKRLLLAQALTPRPALLVLDEPLNHLDGPGVGLAIELLQRLRAEGTTMICCHHDLAQVRTLADTVTGLNAGAVVFSGVPAAVLTNENILRTFTGPAAASAPGWTVCGRG
jgi:zinc transport system ATP-binding protein